MPVEIGRTKHWDVSTDVVDLTVPGAYTSHSIALPMVLRRIVVT